MAAAFVTTHQANEPVPATGPAPPPMGASAVFRRTDDQICHTRCQTPLAYRGVRGRQETDFYCFRCTLTVTVPVVILEKVLGAPADPPMRLVAGRGRHERSVRIPETDWAA